MIKVALVAQKNLSQECPFGLSDEEKKSSERLKKSSAEISSSCFQDLLLQ